MTAPTEPMYLYAVTGSAKDNPRVERVRVQYLTKQTVRLAERVAMAGYRFVISKDDLHAYGLVDSPLTAIIEWRAQTERTLQHLEEEVAQLRAQLQKTVPHAWETP